MIKSGIPVILVLGKDCSDQRKEHSDQGKDHSDQVRDHSDPCLQEGLQFSMEGS